MTTASTAKTPSYLSAREAESILSNIRPTQLRADTLAALNIFLDELLWLILSGARSLGTEKIKSSFLKLLSSTMGTEVITEAEIELRSYWDKNPSPKKNPQSAPDAQSFPLEAAFELMRVKCEAYSTLNDTDEDVEVEEQLQKRLAAGSKSDTSAAAFVAPAALYLTAIMEYVTARVLVNVSEITSRDSSRTMSSMQDLHTALAENTSIYPLAKSMRVFEQIEASAMPPPRTSGGKSSNRGNETQTQSQTDSFSSDGHASPPVRQLGRASSESNYVKPKQSIEKTHRPRKSLFRGSRSSLERDGSLQGHGDVVTNGHRRSESVISNRSARLGGYDDWPGDGQAEQEFDELMRSGATMKVSLTPDRLRSSETPSDRNKRPSRATASPPPTSTPGSLRGTRATDAMGMMAVESSFDSSSYSHRQRQVDSIREDDESSNASRKGDNRMRSTSFSASLKDNLTPRKKQQLGSGDAGNNRNRAYSTSAAVTFGTTAPPRVSSLTTSPSPPPLPSNAKMHSSDRDAGFPKRNRPVRAANRESLDLDDVMGDSEDEMEVPIPSTPAKSKAGGVSASTRDLMEFLNSAPPPDVASTLPPSSFETGKQRSGSGRLRTMMSRLGRATSTERLNQQPSLLSKKSLQDLPKAMKPVPPRYPPSSSFRTGTPPSSPSQTSSVEGLRHNQNGSALPPTTASKPPIVRKAAPPLDKSASSKDSDVSTSLPTPPATVRVDPIQKTVPEKASQSPVNGKPSVVIPVVRPKAPSRSGTGGVSVKTPDITTPTQTIVAPKSATPAKVAVPPKPAGQTAVPIESEVSPVQGTVALHAEELRRLAAKATSADECRLLIELFLIKCGLPSSSASPKAEASSSLSGATRNGEQLESTDIIGFLLSDEPLAERVVVQEIPPDNQSKAPSLRAPSVHDVSRPASRHSSRPASRRPSTIDETNTAHSLVQRAERQAIAA